jgi:hypothetical protein
MAAFCHRCGVRLQPNAQFCQECGAVTSEPKLVQAAPEPVTQPMPPTPNSAEQRIPSTSQTKAPKSEGLGVLKVVVGIWVALTLVVLLILAFSSGNHRQPPATGGQQGGHPSANSTPVQLNPPSPVSLPENSSTQSAPPSNESVSSQTATNSEPQSEEEKRYKIGTTIFESLTKCLQSKAGESAYYGENGGKLLMQGCPAYFAVWRRYCEVAGISRVDCDAPAFKMAQTYSAAAQASTKKDAQ